MPTKDTIEMWKKAVFHSVVIAICLSLIIAGIITKVTEIVGQTWQGFICGDPSLSKPFKYSTDAYDFMITINYIVPCFVTIIELAIHGRKNWKNFMVVAIRCLMWIQQYFFVYILCFVTVHYIKCISGFPRPYFLTECIPDLAINCTKGEFIGTGFVCTNPNMTDFVYANIPRSFPSLNTAIATYLMVFIIWYLQRRLSKIPLIVPILATMATWWVLYNSISRITEHAHHVIDVIGAFIIVFPFVVYLNFRACKNFEISSKLNVNEFKCLGIIKCASCNEKKYN